MRSSLESEVQGARSWGPGAGTGAWYGLMGPAMSKRKACECCALTARAPRRGLSLARASASTSSTSARTARCLSSAPSPFQHGRGASSKLHRLGPFLGEAPLPHCQLLSSPFAPALRPVEPPEQPPRRPQQLRQTRQARPLGAPLHQPLLQGRAVGYPSTPSFVLSRLPGLLAPCARRMRRLARARCSVPRRRPRGTRTGTSFASLLQPQASWHSVMFSGLIIYIC
jgi:hypothetical protein